MSPEKKWLVKSSDSIQGPLEFDVVVENIFTGDIHLLDEIKGPFERWRPIKDHSLFAAAIEKLKATTYQTRENTMTATVDLATKTIEHTNSETISITNKLGEASVTPRTDETAIPPDDQQVMDEFSQHQKGIPHVAVGRASTSRRFPMSFLVAFLMIVMGAASYLVYEYKQTRLIEQKTSAYAQLTDIAIDSLKVGEYQKALKNFRMAHNINSTDPNLLIEMSPLLIQFGGQFSQTHALLESMLLQNRQKNLVKKARNIIGLSFSYREQFGEALASYDQALQMDDQYQEAHLNKAYVLIKLGRYEEAVSLMAEVVSENPDDAIAHYFYIRSLAEKGLGMKDELSLKEALSVSDQYSQRFADFRQEVLFLIAVVNHALGAPPEKMKELINNFLKVDLELTKLHVHDPSVDFQSFNWLDYMKYCQNMESGLEEYQAQMLRAFCLLKANQPVEAKKIFEGLMSTNNNDGILQALYASTLLGLNDVSQAKNALGFINQIEDKKPVVETILRGCLRAGDLKCGEAIFKGRHAKHISLLYSHWGNSEINFAKDRRKTKSSVVLGLQISPNFAPLLKIKRKF